MCSVCRECGLPNPPSLRKIEFCSAACRLAFNNRRLKRGTEMYDLFMALRYEREKSRLLKVWKHICRLAYLYRQADLEERNGRHSWIDPNTVIERRPYLFANIVERDFKV